MPADLDELLDEVLDDFEISEDGPESKEGAYSADAPVAVGADQRFNGGTSNVAANREQLVDEFIESIGCLGSDLLNKENSPKMTEPSAGQSFHSDVPIPNLRDPDFDMESLNSMLRDMKEEDFFEMMNELVEPEFLDVIQQCIDKDFLFSMIKEMNDNYPVWLEQNKSELSEDDYTRYTRQYEIVQQILKQYEKENNWEVLVELIDKMCEYGTPPQGLIKAGFEGMADLASLFEKQ